MIKEIKQDIFLAKCEAIVHQANCFCTMGSGIAKFIREKLPEAYDADCQTKRGDISKLGKASVAKITRPLPENRQLRVVFNLYGQFDMGEDKRYTRYDALADGFERIRKYMETYALKTLAIPARLGCNRAGGDWRVVKAIIESVFSESKLDVIICENPAVDPLQNEAAKS